MYHMSIYSRICVEIIGSPRMPVPPESVPDILSVNVKTLNNVAVSAHTAGVGPPQPVWGFRPPVSVCFRLDLDS